MTDLLTRWISITAAEQAVAGGIIITSGASENEQTSVHDMMILNTRLEISGEMPWDCTLNQQSWGACWEMLIRIRWKDTNARSIVAFFMKPENAIAWSELPNHLDRKCWSGWNSICRKFAGDTQLSCYVQSSLIAYYLGEQWASRSGFWELEPQDMGYLERN